MAELTDIISNAISDAEAGGADAGTETSTDGTNDTGSDAEAAGAGTSPAGAEGAAVAAGADAAAKTPEQDDIDKELEALGIHAPQPGERENRLPHSRVKKIVAKALKARDDAHTAALSEHTQKLTKAEQRLQNMDLTDRLIASDPDRYVEMLAALHPAYKKFLTGGGAGGGKAAEQAAAASASDPMPAPDAKYEDGSLGYTPEGLGKLLDWQSRQAETRVEQRLRAEYDKRLSPIENERKAAAVIAETRPKIRAQIESAEKMWGQPFKDDYAKDKDSEILKFMRTNPTVPFGEAVAAVLIPKIQADRNRMRTELLAEINGRPGAAARTGPAAVVASKVDDGSPRKLEDVIRASIAASGLR